MEFFTNAIIRIAIHRLDKILGMTTLCIGSDVSVLSRSQWRKEGSITGTSELGAKSSGTGPKGGLTDTSSVPEPFGLGSGRASRPSGRHSLHRTPLAAIRYSLLIP